MAAVCQHQTLHLMLDYSRTLMNWTVCWLICMKHRKQASAQTKVLGVTTNIKLLAKQEIVRQLHTGIQQPQYIEDLFVIKTKLSLVPKFQYSSTYKYAFRYTSEPGNCKGILPKLGSLLHNSEVLSGYSPRCFLPTELYFCYSHARCMNSPSEPQ